jgi:hypothetical protein
MLLPLEREIDLSLLCEQDGRLWKYIWSLRQAVNQNYVGPLPALCSLYI